MAVTQSLEIIIIQIYKKINKLFLFYELAEHHLSPNDATLNELLNEWMREQSHKWMFMVYTKMELIRYSPIHSH